MAIEDTIEKGCCASSRKSFERHIGKIIIRFINGIENYHQAFYVALVQKYMADIVQVSI